ncbi:hypothetical protein L2E82_08569 [Cichorium intybus]|uniref:Uncharacterized protein n=1 Tax=Cichorium intybus TaxID=13427 RepID=A0ACB9G6N5_CICIN|nr:hypothetical protein L2E82_08569 [Cichorium intybus]
MHLQILVAAVAMAALGAASAQLKPRCKKPCGNVTIEYPFGYQGCYYNRDFLVTCNQTSGTPIPFLGKTTTNIVISNISTERGELEIMMFVASDCYNSSGPTRRGRPSLRLGKLERGIRVSTNNTFVAIGCDTRATISGTRGKVNDVTGCFSRCLKDSLITNGSCSGVGCCEVAVPGGMSFINISVTSYNNHTAITDFNPCSYAFFLKNGKYSFSTVDLRDFQRRRMPMLLEWSIGNLTCNSTSKDVGNFICKGNSRCDENYGGPGYRCRCNEGYVGNPYVANDCKNINECENGNHDCRHRCIDKEGSYECKCPKGYSGDGKKGGSGCMAEQSMVIKIAVGSSAAAIFLIVFVNWLYFGLKKRKHMLLREKFFRQNGGIMLQQRISGDKVLVELLTGKKVLNFDRPEEERNLAKTFLSSLKDGRLFQVLDEQLQQNEDHNEITKVSKLAERCLLVKGDERPAMKEVAMELEGILASKIQKHPWVEHSLNEEEGEYLLKEPTNIYEFTDGADKGPIATAIISPHAAINPISTTSNSIFMVIEACPLENSSDGVSIVVFSFLLYNAFVGLSVITSFPDSFSAVTYELMGRTREREVRERKAEKIISSQSS